MMVQLPFLELAGFAFRSDPQLFQVSLLFLYPDLPIMGNGRVKSVLRKVVRKTRSCVRMSSTLSFLFLSVIGIRPDIRMSDSDQD